MNKFSDYDYLAPDEYSEEESSISSNDELPDIDIYLHNKYGTRHFKKSNESLDEISAKDFEETLNDELEIMCRDYESNLIKTNVKDNNDNTEESIPPDPFYDPNSDDENQKWVDDLRKSYRYKSKTGKETPLSNSDAVLNCPCCMSLLCLDCQRHQMYKTQYRAMFVLNCEIDESKNIYYPVKLSSQNNKDIKRLRKNVEEATNISTAINADVTSIDQDVYKCVLCSICKTEVGVYDLDEIYHFHNVLSSYS
ncbi:unnamed protein product [Gordionus sp. m RMFG-2023]|uniref:E2F-associated phosphoprotein-like n=1 Tax=Gordionus sp. m RMFG-2023 TaxID=3053472 RepID=UPI0030E33F05